MKSNKSRKYHYIIIHLLQSVKPGFMFIVRAKVGPRKIILRASCDSWN